MEENSHTWHYDGREFTHLTLWWKRIHTHDTMMEENSHTRHYDGREFTHTTLWWKRIHTHDTMMEENSHTRHYDGREFTHTTLWWKRIHTPDTMMEENSHTRHYDGREFTHLTLWWKRIHTHDTMMEENSHTWHYDGREFTHTHARTQFEELFLWTLKFFYCLNIIYVIKSVFKSCSTSNSSRHKTSPCSCKRWEIGQPPFLTIVFFPNLNVVIIKQGSYRKFLKGP